MTEVAYQNGWPVPDGWKLVAVEPTYEMECEVGGVRIDEDSCLDEYASHEKVREICCAVVKYSPPPPKAPDYNPGPLEVSVVGMPEFDALIDHIYEEGTSGGAVIHLANKLVRAAIQSHMRHARNSQPVAYKWGGVLIRAEESHPVHRKEGQPLYAAPVAAQAPIHPAIREGVEAAFEQRPRWPEKISAAVRHLPDAAQAPAADGDALDAAFEAVRQRLCKLPRYSFIIGHHGGVRQVVDRSGNWIAFDAAHNLFDPVSVDAAMQRTTGSEK